MPPLLARTLLLCTVPLAALGPALLPGRRLLPIRPDVFEPLASEAPAQRARAPARPNLLAVDGVTPLLTDRIAIRARALAGELPLWEERLGLGLPLLGTTMAGPFYPPGLLRILLPPDLAAGWHALAALFLAGLGIWLLLERRGLSAGACAVGALAFQAGGWGLANLQLTPKVDAALWLPWALWAIDGVLERKRGAGPALFAASAFPFLAGFPSVAVFGFAASVVYALWRGRGVQGGPGPLARALAFSGLGVAAAAVQLGPTWAASAESLRGPLPAAEVAGQALPLGTALGLALPHLFGDPGSQLAADRDPLTWALTRREEGPRAEQANALEWDLFAGVGALLLALTALAARPGRALFPALLALAGLAFAQGWPVVSLLYHVPGLNLGTPARAAVLCWVAWAWLAALGTQALLDGARRARRVALAAALLMAAGAAAAPLALDLRAWTQGLPSTLAARFSVPQDAVAERVDLEAAPKSAQRLERAAIHCACAAAATLLAVLLAGRRRAPGLRPAPGPWLGLATVVAAEGLLVGWPHLGPCTAGPSGEMFPPSAGMAALEAAAAGGRALRLDQSPSGVDDVLRLARPNLPQVYDIADLTPYVAFPHRRTVELLQAIDRRSRYRTGVSRLSDPGLLDHPVLDLLRVTAVLSREALEHPRLEPVLERDGFHVYRRRDALPPAWIVPEAIETPSDSTALGLLASRTVDPRRAVVLAPGVDSGPAPDSRAVSAASSVAWQRPSPERLEVDVRGSPGGWLVLSEAWDPGWRARLNGLPTPLLRADHALRALRLPPGDCSVSLAYQPSSLRAGAAVSLIALLLALWLSLRSSPGAQGPRRPL